MLIATSRIWILLKSIYDGNYDNTLAIRVKGHFVCPIFILTCFIPADTGLNYIISGEKFKPFDNLNYGFLKTKLCVCMYVYIYIHTHFKISMNIYYM